MRRFAFLCSLVVSVHASDTCLRLQDARLLALETCFPYTDREDGMRIEHLLSSVYEELCR